MLVCLCFYVSYSLREKFSPVVYEFICVCVGTRSPHTFIYKVRSQIILQVGVKDDEERAIKFLDADEQVASVVQGDGFLVVTLKEEVTDYSEIPTALIGEGFKLTLFQEEEVNLESAFMALTKGTGQNF